MVSFPIIRLIEGRILWLLVTETLSGSIVTSIAIIGTIASPALAFLSIIVVGAGWEANKFFVSFVVCHGSYDFDSKFWRYLRWKMRLKLETNLWKTELRLTCFCYCLCLYISFLLFVVTFSIDASWGHCVWRDRIWYIMTYGVLSWQFFEHPIQKLIIEYCSKWN